MDHAVRFVKTQSQVLNVLAKILTFWKLTKGLAKLSVSYVGGNSSSLYTIHLWYSQWKPLGKFGFGDFLKIGNNFHFAAHWVILAWSRLSLHNFACIQILYIQQYIHHHSLRFIHQTPKVESYEEIAPWDYGHLIICLLAICSVQERGGAQRTCPDRAKQ